jgi:hypothetical protein
MQNKTVVDSNQIVALLRYTFYTLLFKEINNLIQKNRYIFFALYYYSDLE